MGPRFQIIGDIIILKREEDLQFAEELIDRFKWCKSVVLYKGVHGKFRVPSVELIIGEGTETVVKENGCFFKLDLSKVMFCPGNLGERMRMSRLGSNEFVVDMFAGIGYFSIPMAVHSRPRKIVAIEANPDAYEFLVENIKLNRVEHIVEPVLGDCADRTPKGADRIIMGYLDAFPYLKTAVEALRVGGILHYHEGVPKRILDRPIRRLRDYGMEIVSVRKVKKYAPGVLHVVVDARKTCS